jgi:hypothetical protein
VLAERAETVGIHECKISHVLADTLFFGQTVFLFWGQTVRIYATFL